MCSVRKGQLNNLLHNFNRDISTYKVEDLVTVTGKFLLSLSYLISEFMYCRHHASQTYFCNFSSHL